MSFRTVPRGIFRVLSVVMLCSGPFWEHSWKHRAARVVLCGLYAYVGILVMLLALQDRLLFCPLGADSWSDPPPGLGVQDVELTSADGTRIHAWWAAPKGWEAGQGAVLFCHGNGGNLSHRGGALRPWLEQLKQAVLLFDYPGYGRSGGTLSEAGCYAAGDAGYDWLVRVQKVPPQRVLLYGGSLGGGIATDLASRRPHRALVLVSTFTSIPDMAQKQYPWLPGRWLVHNQFNNLAKIPACRGPVFIAHDPEDWLIPFSQGERLFAAAGEPKRFFVMHHLGHNDSPTAETFPALARFLEEVEARSMVRPAQQGSRGSEKANGAGWARWLSRATTLTPGAGWAEVSREPAGPVDWPPPEPGAAALPAEGLGLEPARAAARLPVEPVPGPASGTWSHPA